MTSVKDSGNSRESVQYGDALPTVVSQIADCNFQLFSFCIQCCQHRLLCAYTGTNCALIRRAIFAGGLGRNRSKPTFSLSDYCFGSSLCDTCEMFLVCWRTDSFGLMSDDSPNLRYLLRPWTVAFTVSQPSQFLNYLVYVNLYSVE